jgi:alpha-beta hydrolase superfamily lysophospholipase
MTTIRHEERISGTGGVSLFLRSWRPAGNPRGVVIVVHGFLAHSGLYEWTATQLAAAGFAAYAFDLRGHGRSEGERFWIDRFDDYVADLGGVDRLVEARHPGTRRFVLGHSAGGVIASLYASEHGSGLAGLVSESFAFELPAPDFAVAVLRGIDHLAPHAPVLKLKPEDFSRDNAFVEALREDPLVVHTPGPTHTLAEMARADERLRGAFGKIALPVLILHGTADRAAKSHGSQRFFDSVGSPDKTLKLYEGFFHDPLNDVGKEQVVSDVLEWLGKRSPAQ